MKNTDISIGNYILFPLEQESGLLLPCISRRVDAIVFDEVVSLNPPNYPQNCTAYIKNCMGISLNENWILKFGWNKNGLHQYKPNNEITMKFDALGWRLIYSESLHSFGIEPLIHPSVFIPVEYVHELQNKFRELTKQLLK